MSPELRKYYEDRFQMMATDGWKDLMQDVAEMLKATDTLGSVSDLRELGLRQGEVSMMRWLLSLQKVSEEAYEELNAEDSP